MNADISRNGSSRYTHGHESSTLAAHGARTAENSCGYLLPHLSPGMSVLDIGCGPGSITLDLARHVAPGVVTGVENVEAPLIAARDAAQDRGDETTLFEIADALALPYEDGAFDVVHAHQVLQHVPDPVIVLREMRRVCGPGGWIAARDADYAAMAWFPRTEGMEHWRSTYRAIARANGGEPDAGRHLRRWARESGVEHPRITTSVWTYADPSACRWWGTSQAARISAPGFRRQAHGHGLTDSDVDEMVDEWITWSEDPDAWFALPHGELLARA